MTAFVFLLACLAATAQEVTLTVEAPESAVAGERFRIIYTINSTDGQFTPPKFDPSFSVQGPQQSTSRNVQWINGDMKAVSSTTLIYYVSVGAPGTYTIPAAQFETKKITVSSQEKQIVINAGASAQQAPGQQQGQTEHGQTHTGQFLPQCHICPPPNAFSTIYMVFGLELCHCICYTVSGKNTKEASL